ncbi:alpha/beta hydrolase [Coxiella burnetii]|uniref:Esterase family protein n=1 Tax=Coxiella burnetii (strain RSA 493 / Nine Mile phase I) TaxID=227377 RepID=Q83DH9_COXBU|nr:alpha/beta fold hydrolase [Coxiella burnetii]NP_819778.2 esterase family protein [Coxiella burnetii RSA 493]AAO90292.2 esterase family protein [Coxiella burnetii RSA 493]ARI65590.1 alpha/beta hydrolase [Coxiella burnetii]ARK27067.1 alpha/beta hydrolase [Coxiella burnetii]ATN82173.1 esterase [Coxiella burnetii]ATN84074.1 esterase [Coxiella burnetii]
MVVNLMSRTVKVGIVLLAAFFLLLFIFLLIGHLLDKEAERVVNQLYGRNEKGIIKGMEPIQHVHSHLSALIIIHGYLGSPDIFRDLADNKKINAKVDVYVPLLPYEGRNLETVSKYNNKLTSDYLKTYINKLSPHYKHVVILAYSYGGALLINLARENQLPKNSQIILYAPAVFVKGNGFRLNVLLRTYSLWRKYCNYAAIGCEFPGKNIADETATVYIENMKSLRYIATPAVKEIFKLDDNNRAFFKKMCPSFSVIIAKDDSLISYEQLNEACRENHCCKIYTYPSGNHLLHVGKFKEDFTHLITKLINQKI